jgi:hypothetical protein
VDVGIICTSESSAALTTSELEYNLYTVTANTYSMASTSSRIVARVKATTTGNPNLAIFVGDEADSHLTLPSVTVDSSTFIPYTGATLDVNLGTHNLVTTGSASVNQLQVASASTPGYVLTALDSLGNSHWATLPSSGVTLTGAVTGAGTGSIATTLATSSVTPGTYTNSTFTVNSYGIVTSASSGVGITPRIINAQIGTSYTLQLSDAGNVVTMNNSGASNVTVPASASVPFPIGTVIDIVQLGAGAVTIAGSGSAVVNSQSGYNVIAAQYVGVSVMKYAANTWILLGSLIV